MTRFLMVWIVAACLSTTAFCGEDRAWDKELYITERFETLGRVFGSLEDAMKAAHDRNEKDFANDRARISDALPDVQISNVLKRGRWAAFTGKLNGAFEVKKVTNRIIDFPDTNEAKELAKMVEKARYYLTENMGKAEKGEELMQLALGFAHWRGEGIPVKVAEAFKWFGAGTDHRNPVADAIKENIKNHMLALREQTVYTWVAHRIVLDKATRGEKTQAQLEQEIRQLQNQKVLSEKQAAFSLTQRANHEKELSDWTKIKADKPMLDVNDQIAKVKNKMDNLKADSERYGRQVADMDKQIEERKQDIANIEIKRKKTAELRATVLYAETDAKIVEEILRMMNENPPGIDIDRLVATRWRQGGGGSGGSSSDSGPGVARPVVNPGDGAGAPAASGVKYAAVYHMKDGQKIEATKIVIRTDDKHRITTADGKSIWVPMTDVERVEEK